MKLTVLDNATSQIVLESKLDNEESLSLALHNLEQNLKNKLTVYEKGCYTVIHKDGARTLNVFRV
jgi:Rps23 Pro-64 3,4-dihydroxylase Tpa1-like proline 4-hydroxylase